MAEWLLAQEGILIYVGLALSLLGGAVGLPIPEDVPLVVGGVLIQQGAAPAGAVFFVCYTSVVVGDLIIFFIGRRYGSALFSAAWFKKRVPLKKIRKIRLKLERRSFFMIILARHLFYMRTVTFLTCGAVKMSWQRFLIADATAALISAPVMLALGYAAAEHVDSFKESRNAIEIGLLIVVLIAVCVYVYRKKVRSGGEGTDSEREIQDNASVTLENASKAELNTSGNGV